MVILTEVRDHRFAHEPAQRVLQLGLLNEEIVFRVIGDANTALASVLAGDVDTSVGITIDWVEAVDNGATDL